MTARDCVLGVWRGLITQPRLFLRHCCRQPPQPTPNPNPHPPTIFQLLQISPIWLRAIINPTRWHNFWSQSFEQERPFMNKCSSSTYLVSSHYHFQMGVLGIFIITALNLALQSQVFRKMQTKSCICRFLRSGSFYPGKVLGWECGCRKNAASNPEIISLNNFVFGSLVVKSIFELIWSGWFSGSLSRCLVRHDVNWMWKKRQWWGSVYKNGLIFCLS